MAISFIGAAAAAATTLTLPAGRQLGDFEVMWVFRSGSTTAPTIPSDWILIKSGTTTSTWGGAYYRWCTNTADTSGTFTNASGLACAVYRGVFGVGTSPAASGAVSSSIAYPTVGTFTQTGGNSWAVGCAGHRTATAASVNVAPTGMTIRTAATTGFAAISDTNGGVSSWSTASVTVSASSGHEQLTFELLADASTFNPYRKAAQVTLSGGNKTATATAGINTVSNSYGTLPRSGDKRLFKLTMTTVVVDDPTIGIANPNSINTGSIGDSGDGNNSLGLTNSGGVFINGVQIATVTGFTNGDGVWVAVDDAAKQIYFAVNSGTWNNSGANPDAGTGGISYSSMNSGFITPAQSFFDGGESVTYDGNPGSPPANVTTFSTWDFTGTPLVASAAGLLVDPNLPADRRASVAAQLNGSATALLAQPAVPLPCGGSTFGQEVSARLTAAQASVVAINSQPLGTPPRLNLLVDAMFGPPGMVPDYDWPNPQLAKSSIVCLTTGPPYQGTPFPLRLPPAPFARLDWPNPVLPASDLVAITAQVGVPHTFYLGTDAIAGRQALAWPNPVVARVATQVFPVGLSALELATPFNRTDWPNPVVVRPLPASQVAGLSALALAQPFAKLDWPNPATARPTASAQQTGLSVLQLAIPFAKTDWPNPVVVRVAPSATPGASIALLAPPVAAPFAQLDWPNPGRVVRSADTQALGSFAGLISPVVAAAPFAQRDWPTPRAIPRVPVSIASGLSALQLAAPFGKLDWPNPVVAKVAAQTFFAPPPIEVETVAPFAQLSWPNPVVVKFAVQVFRSSLPPTSPAIPFAQTNWPNPILGRAAGQAFPAQLPPTPPTLPFAKLDWPNPIVAKVAGQTVFASRPIETETVAPFSQTDWPNPVVAKFVWQVFPAQLPPTPGAPFAKLDWPNPIVAKVAGQGIQWQRTPVPPVPPPAPCQEIIFGVIGDPRVEIAGRIASDPSVASGSIVGGFGIVGWIGTSEVATTAKIDADPVSASGTISDRIAIDGGMSASAVTVSAKINDPVVTLAGDLCSC